MDTVVPITHVLILAYFWGEVVNNTAISSALVSAGYSTWLVRVDVTPPSAPAPAPPQSPASLLSPPA